MLTTANRNERDNQIVALYMLGHSYAEVAEKVDLSPSSAARIFRKRQEEYANMDIVIRSARSTGHQYRNECVDALPLSSTALTNLRKLNIHTIGNLIDIGRESLSGHPSISRHCLSQIDDCLRMFIRELPRTIDTDWL